MIYLRVYNIVIILAALAEHCKHLGTVVVLCGRGIGAFEEGVWLWRFVEYVIHSAWAVLLAKRIEAAIIVGGRESIIEGIA